MKRIDAYRLTVIMGLALGITAATFAAAPTEPTDLPPEVEVKSYQGIPYLSGGVSEEAREELKAEAEGFNLKLMFATQSGHYLSDVKVSVQEAGGQTVLEAVSQGPWLYTKLPSGKYTVMAEAQGKVQQQTAQVGGKERTELRFYWPDEQPLP
jgi:hypothetical protein